MFKLELKTILSSICQLNSLLHQQTVTVTMKACPPDAVMIRCISIFVAMVPWKSWKLLELSSYVWLLIWSVSKSTKLFYLVSYGGIMKGWKWKCEFTQINAIFLPRELARTPVHCCKTSNSKTTVQIKTENCRQFAKSVWCEFKSAGPFPTECEAAKSTQFTAELATVALVGLYLDIQQVATPAQSYIYISGKLDIAMQNICGVPVKGNIVF